MTQFKTVSEHLNSYPKTTYTSKIKHYRTPAVFSGHFQENILVAISILGRQ